jgi:hypothetical protein
MYETLGLLFCDGLNHLGDRPFSAIWGPNTIPGDQAFVSHAYNTIFGVAPPAQVVQGFVSQLDFFETLYIQSGAFGSDLNEISLFARGAVFGQMLGIGVQNFGLGIEAQSFDQPSMDAKGRDSTSIATFNVFDDDGVSTMGRIPEFDWALV